MGVTSKSVEIINKVLKLHTVKSVCDLGAQNDYQDHIVRTGPSKYPYFSEWWKAKGVDYISIDLNGENDAKKWDLSKPIKTDRTFDLVCDFGTSEHVQEYYQCLSTIDQLTKVGGYIIKENPKTGNWPGHGYHYVDQQFYKDLCAKTGYELIHIEEHPAMGNITDGWNVIVIMKKTREGFVSKKDFPNVFTK